jgi:IS5 family transposase
MPVAKQQTFAGLAWQNKGKQTKRERFLAEMDAIIPWEQLLTVIEPHYPKAGNGRPPLGLEKMLRIYFLQIWFNLSDPGAEEALYDSESMRRFAKIELAVDKVPCINGLMERKGLLLRSGTIVDATIIAAPSSTKNATDSRDPEMKQTKKGNNWHFGMKLHVGTDTRGVVHSVTATHAAAGDITQMDTLLHGEERTIFGDQAYWKEADRQRFRTAGVRYRVNRRGTAQRPLTEHQKKINQSRSRTRARGEHAFRIVKQLWGFAKVRYRGIAKNAARALTSFALANLYLMRRSIVPQQAWCV